jgi:chloramphenicol O-acetyltransferase type A
MTVKIDITNIILSKQKIYPVMLHAITKVVNRHEEFRTSFDDNGNIGIYDFMFPSYTIFHKESETFSNIWTQYYDDFGMFFLEYQEDIRKYGGIDKMDAKPGQPQNTFPISMIPWESFDGFNLNIKNGYDYLLPIFTIGKYYEHDTCFFIPLSIQVHHAVCDGFHVCRFIQELRDFLK